MSGSTGRIGKRRDVWLHVCILCARLKEELFDTVQRCMICNFVFWKVSSHGACVVHAMPWPGSTAHSSSVLMVL